MQTYPFSMLKCNSCTVISFFPLELKQKGKEKIQIQGNVPLHQQPGAWGALFMPPVQNSLWQLPNHCYPSIPSRRMLCSVLGSSVGAPKGNPLLLPTSEPTLHPVVRGVLVWQAVGLALPGVHPGKGVEDITGPLFLISLNQQWNYPESHIAYKSEFYVAKLTSEVFYKHLVAQQSKKRSFS